MSTTDARDLSDDELFALLDNAESQAKLTVSSALPRERGEAFLQDLLKQVGQLQHEQLAPQILLERVLQVLLRILECEGSSGSSELGIGTMLRSLGGGGIALRLFSDLLFRVKRALANSNLISDRQRSPISSNGSGAHLTDTRQIIDQLTYIVRWYVQRARTLNSLQISPEQKISRESDFALACSIVELLPHYSVLRVLGAMCITGFSQQRVTLKLVLKEFKKSVLLRSKWDSWAENIRAVFDIRETPRAAALYSFVPESSSMFLDYFELDIPLAALDVDCGVHQLQPVLRVEDCNGRGVQRVLAPIEVDIKPGLATEAILPSGQLAGIFRHDWIQGNRIYNIQSHILEEDKLFALRLDLDLMTHEQDQIMVVVRVLESSTNSWLMDPKGVEFKKDREFRLNHAFHTFRNVEFKLNLQEFDVAADIRKNLMWEVRVMDPCQKVLVGTFYPLLSR